MGMFYVATKASDVASEYAVFTTDGVAERVYTDANGDSAYNATETAAVAWFKQFENTLYLSMDASCESGGSSVEPCLQKGDLIFIADANWGQTQITTSTSVRGSAGTKDFFGGGTVQSYAAGFADPAGDGTSNTGYVQVIKFTPATTGTFTYVSQCSNRGLCNTDDALCECFKGYTNDNCDTQSSL